MSTRLIQALDDIKNMPEITLGNIADKTKEEAILMISLISILPFMQPIPIPGLSTILGLVVLLQGISLIFYQKPLLTRHMRDVIISKKKFEIIYRAALRIARFTSRLSAHKHPLIRNRMVYGISGLAIILSAAFLSLPLPIPFSNLIPALSIFFICIGLLEEDVVLVLTGYVITASIVWMTLFSYHILKELLSSWS
jgi:hypothetical protein